MTIDKDTKLFGSFSHNPGSKGALFFNHAFDLHGINAIYKSFYVEDIEKGVQAARTLGMGGFAVAMPHKKSILPFLDEIDPKAREIGSVNTVVNQGGKFTGFNTDYLGICKILLILKVNEYVVVGNGGLAASVTFCLKENKLKYTMVTRSNWDHLNALRDRAIINCTPVSLTALHSSNTVIDFNIGQVYGDKLHELQAQEQFRLYTGLEYGTQDLSRTNVQEYN